MQYLYLFFSLFFVVLIISIFYLFKQATRKNVCPPAAVAVLLVRRQSLIVAGPSGLSIMINDLDADGQTPLLLACTYASPKAVEMLLDRGADMNLSTRTLSTPLIAACLIALMCLHKCQFLFD